MSLRRPGSRVITPSEGDQPQSPPAVEPAVNTDPDSEFWRSHDMLSAAETSAPNEHADLHMVHAFGSPKEWRTMSKINPRLVHMLAGIHARGRVNGSRFRVAVVEDYFLMMRSSEGYGSEQMVRVASARNGAGPGPEPKGGGLLRGWFGGNKGP